MSSRTIDIGRFVRVPMHILHADISSRAREVWMMLALNCSPEKPFAWARQASVAESLRCSTDTVGRALKKLIKAGLIAETGRWHWGRYKIYQIAWLPVMSVDLLSDCDEVILDVEPAPVQKMKKQVAQKQKQKASSRPMLVTADELLEENEEKWTQEFECLDGNSGRPSVATCVKEAMNHTARHKCDDLTIYIETWLRNATKVWKYDFYKEQTLPATDPSLSPEVVARKLKEATERRWNYQQGVLAPGEAEKYKRVWTEEENAIGEKWMHDNGFTNFAMQS
jgi:predicted transcriptional regulator